MKNIKTNQVIYAHIIKKLSPKFRHIHATAVKCIVSLGIIIVMISCTQKPITKTIFALGAPLTIQVYAGGSAKAINKAFENTVAIEKHMSTSPKDYSDTDIMHINAQSITAAQEGKTTPINYETIPQIVTVLKTSLFVSRETAGSFDVTIEPLVRLWGFGSDTIQRVPKKNDIQNALPRIHWDTIQIYSPTEFSMNPGQSIDVGGIAKGYACDTAIEILKTMGVTSALIDFGGNICTIGEKKINGTLWRIGIQAPFEPINTIVGTVSVGETAVVSSGVYERYFEQDGVRYFHIVDPQTGYPARNGLWSVTIITPQGIIADGFSTGVFVLGLEKGMALVERTQSMEAIFITDKNEIYITSGLVDNFELLSDSYHMGVAIQK